MQHTQLNTEVYGLPSSKHCAYLDRLLWDLRDTSCLLRLELDSWYVEGILILQPKLPSLQYLKIGELNYNKEQAGQLVHLSTLTNLQVRHLLQALAET